MLTSAEKSPIHLIPALSLRIPPFNTGRFTSRLRTSPKLHNLEHLKSKFFVISTGSEEES